MMIEPPGELLRRRIFEIHDGVFIAIEEAVVEKLRGPVRQTGEGELGAGMDCALDETREESGRGCAVEAMVVIEDPRAHLKL